MTDEGVSKLLQAGWENLDEIVLGNKKVIQKECVFSIRDSTTNCTKPPFALCNSSTSDLASKYDNI